MGPGLAAPYAHHKVKVALIFRQVRRLKAVGSDAGREAMRDAITEEAVLHEPVITQMAPLLCLGGCGNARIWYSRPHLITCLAELIASEAYPNVAIIMPVFGNLRESKMVRFRSDATSVQETDVKRIFLERNKLFIRIMGY
ncbi:hypothetical protein CLG96_14785 [Sphingomonas oleivorans]|uniref:Uncharacterized protein n=1 Tax=Sphingomonas oleivorans TaxID=1735121 RepID=A0A2T5FV92_9SPHN|nr:hypothetical protein CLG96_14785 [Sphingomonas oleivorans]